jgi:hypothetical protein
MHAFDPPEELYRYLGEELASARAMLAGSVEMVREGRFRLFVSAAGLVSFGRLDAAADAFRFALRDGSPPVRLVSLVADMVGLPPHLRRMVNSACGVDPGGLEPILEWLAEHGGDLEWDEKSGRFVPKPKATPVRHTASRSP